MQMRVLNGFDRTLRLAGEHTSGLMRNESVDNWKKIPGMKKLTGTDARIAAIKAEIAAMDRKEANRKYGK